MVNSRFYPRIIVEHFIVYKYSSVLALKLAINLEIDSTTFKEQNNLEMKLVITTKKTRNCSNLTTAK